MKNKLIYVASPYYHDNPYVMSNRYKAVAGACYLLLREGFNPISPICHWHPIKNLPVNFDRVDNDLNRINKFLLLKCDIVIVLTLNGWEDSTGVKEEVKIAREHGITVQYVDEKEFIPFILKNKE